MRYLASAGRPLEVVGIDPNPSMQPYATQSAEAAGVRVKARPWGVRYAAQHVWHQCRDCQWGVLLGLVP